MTRYESGRNYYNDRRVRGKERRWWNGISSDKHYAIIIEKDSFEEIKVPIRWVVCPTCEGRGTHVNPSIDCDGLSNEDFSEDPDFAEEYIKGTYDVPCYECQGERVVPRRNDELSHEEE